MSAIKRFRATLPTLGQALDFDAAIAEARSEQTAPRKPGCIYKHPHPDHECRNQDDMREGGAPLNDAARAALADVMSLTVDHLDEPRMRVIHKAASRGVDAEGAAPRAEGLDAALADILRWTKPGSLYADGTNAYSPAGPEKVARIHNRARAAFGDAPLPPSRPSDERQP